MNSSLQPGYSSLCIGTRYALISSDLQVFVSTPVLQRRVASADNNIPSTRSEAEPHSSSRHAGGLRDDSESYSARLRKVVFRIWLYPATSCLINATNVALVLVGTIRGVTNTAEYNALLLSDFLYGARAIVYGLLAATDPVRITYYLEWKVNCLPRRPQALVRAIQYLYRRYRPASTQPRRLGFGSETTVSVSRPDDSTNSTTHLRTKSQTFTGSHALSGFSGRSRGFGSSRAQHTAKSRSRSKTRPPTDRPPLQLSSIQVYVQSTSVQVDDGGTPVVEHTNYTERGGGVEKEAVGNERHERGRNLSWGRQRDVEWAGELGNPLSADRARYRPPGDVDAEPPSAFSPAAHVPLVSKAGTESSEVPSYGPPFLDSRGTPVRKMASFPSAPHLREAEEGAEVYGLDLFTPPPGGDFDDPDDPDFDPDGAGSASGHAHLPHSYSDAKRRERDERRRQRRAEREHAQEVRRAKQEDFMRRI